MRESEIELNKIEEAAQLLIPWFSENARFMPWREDPTPYHVWVSEIMLQQTRVDTVMPYYARFISELPDISALASCEEDRLLKLWEGLGYYSRVRNMQKTAVLLTEISDGGVPRMPADLEELKKLPGIGSYTAGAIASIAFHLPEPVVDGNVLRVISRLLGRFDDISAEKTKTAYEALLRTVLTDRTLEPSLFNQGLMELGAIRCLPNGAPKCKECPWQMICSACRNELTETLPVKSPKKPRKIREMTVFIIRIGGLVGIEKRQKKGLLSGMYGFPSEDGRLGIKEAASLLFERGYEVSEIRALPDAVHVFTHVEWHMSAFLVDAREIPAQSALIFADRAMMETAYALPAAFRKWEEQR